MYHGERFNAYSHLAGFLLAVAALVLLGSTLYHSIPQPKAKAILQKVDHCMIYLLIAGSYTPFTLITLHGGWGWSLFGVSWGLALLGIVQELTIGRKSEKRLLSMVIYVLMGWLIVVAVWPLIQDCFGWCWAAYCIARGFIGLSTIRKSATATVFGTYLSWQAV